MTAHHRLPARHTLLCGLSAVGEVRVAGKAWSAYWVEVTAADAGTAVRNRLAAAPASARAVAERIRAVGRAGVTSAPGRCPVAACDRCAGR